MVLLENINVSMITNQMKKRCREKDLMWEIKIFFMTTILLSYFFLNRMMLGTGK